MRVGRLHWVFGLDGSSQILSFESWRGRLRGQKGPLPWAVRDF